MTKGQLNYHISKRIRNGDLKSELYEELKEEGNDEALRLALASQPSYELRNYFKMYFWIISSVLGIFILFEFLGLYEFFIDFRIEHLLSVSASIYITVKIWSFSAPFFLSGIIWLSASVVKGYYELPSLVQDPDYDMLRIITILYSIVLFIGVLFMWMVYRNVFGYFYWFRPKVDSENRTRFEWLYLVSRSLVPVNIESHYSESFSVIVIINWIVNHSLRFKDEKLQPPCLWNYY